MEKPPLGYRKILFGWIKPRAKEVTDHQWLNSRPFHRAGKAQKWRKTTDRTNAYKGRQPLLYSVPCVRHSHTSLSLQPFPITGGKGGLDKYLLGDPCQEEKNDYKRGVKRNKRGRPTEGKHQKKLLRSCRGPNLFY